MSRVPLRVRLTVAFAAAMALVLAATGFVLVRHLGGSLDRTLDQGLRARAADVSALVQQADAGLSQAQGLPFANSGFAQVLDGSGRIVDETPGLGPRAVLDARQLAQARHGQLLVPRASVAGGGVRLLAVPITAQGTRLVVVVGAPLAGRDDALAQLRGELLVGGPLALLVASLIGYVVAASALRPVERMRARAAAISARSLSERLPVLESNDEVARLGGTLNQMLARLETALEHERSFVADASHELRTPLAHLRAEVELALESPRERAELEDALRSVGDETDRLSQLADDLLLLARIDNGTMPIRRADVELDELLAGVAVRFERRAREAGRTIETDGGGMGAFIDRLRLEQALGNLVENALRHGAGTIRLAATERDGSLDLHVSDEGPGFPAGFAPHAFERFSRAEPSRSGGGAGLGLAIVAAVAEAHGGTASVDGATVSLCGLAASRCAARLPVSSAIPLGGPWPSRSSSSPR